MTKIQRGTVIRTAGAYDGMTSGTIDILATGASRLALVPTPILEVVVQNDPSSQSNVKVGNKNRQDFVLIAGGNITIPINDLSEVYVRGVTGAATVNWIAMT